jgi:alkylation response protein AidB-like acyl-CoA dehydrogenase
MTMTSEVTEDLSRAAEDLFRRELARPGGRHAAHNAGWSEELWTATASAGWFDVLLSEEHGGLDLGSEAAAALFTLLGRYLVPGPYLDHLVVIPALYRYASRHVRDRFDLARTGSQLIVLADPAACGRSAATDVPMLVGEDLTGTVPLVRFGATASGFVVIARTGANRGAVVFVDGAAPGVTTAPRQSFDPVSAQADLRLDHVRVSGDAVLLPSDEVMTNATVRRLRTTLRLMIAAELAGLARYLLDSSVAYAKLRKQFGRPIGSFQAVQQILGEMAVLVHGAEAYSAEFAARPDPDPAETAALKGFASRTARQVGESALQVHGGIAFTEELELNRWFLRALTLQGLYGDDIESFHETGNALLTGTLQP